MKRLILLASIIIVACASISNAQVQRRVLEEEFTNTGCPPCAATDPYVEAFEADNMEKICVLKYHVSWPDPSDPFYNAQKTKSWDDSRCQGYYGQNGVPYIKFSGISEPLYRLFNVSGATYGMFQSDLQDSMEAVYTMTSPYTIDVSQEIVGDSVIALVTVKAVSATPSLQDLRLACVFAERFNPFHGSNGRPYYTNIVRSVFPGIATDGSISVTADYPALVMTNGDTKTYRYASYIDPSWNRAQLLTVAFIQSKSTKEIFQSNWTVPDIGITISGTTGFNFAPTISPATLTFVNKSPKSQTVSVAYNAPDMPSNWKINVDGADAAGNVTIAAGETKTSNVTMDVTGEAVGSANGIFTFTSAEGVGIGGVAQAYFGSANTDVIIDGGAGVGALAPELVDMNAAGLKAGIADRLQFMNEFQDWSTFKTVYIAAANGVGIQVGTPEWQSMSDLLDAGGNVLFTGSRTIGIYQSSGNDSYMQNWRDFFHIDPTSNTTSTWSKVNGIDGDQISGGVAATLNPKSTYRQNLVAYDDAFQGLFSNEKRDTVGMKALTSAGKVVYLAFELESLPEADRTSVSKKIIDWFYGNASVRTSENATRFELASYPNPAGLSTTLTYSLTNDAPVTLTISDIMGREVAKLVTGEQQRAGTYEAPLNVSKFAAGTYLVTLNAGGKILTSTLNVVK